MELRLISSWTYLTLRPLDALSTLYFENSSAASAAVKQKLLSARLFSEMAFVILMPLLRFER